MATLVRTAFVAGQLLLAAGWTGAGVQPTGAPAQPLAGVYPATVVSSADPLQQGRVLVTIDGVQGQRWAAPSLPYPATAAAAPRPATAQTVWVVFERGDPSAPIWIGWPGH